MSTRQPVQLMLAHYEEVSLLLASTDRTNASAPARRALLAEIEGVTGTLSTTVVSGESTLRHLLLPPHGGKGAQKAMWCDQAWEFQRDRLTGLM